MIALILGGAPAVWRELAEAEALLAGRKYQIIAANLAGIHHAGRLDAWATLHSDLLPKWAAERAGKPAGRLFTPPTPDERWPGSSGLYALQCALFEMGAAGAVLCGVPMQTEAGHFEAPGAWAGVDDYRRAFEAALPEIGGRVRSMGGWTADLFGAPTAAWVGAIDTTRPAGISAAPNARNDVMHHVKNGSDATLSFWHRQDDGLQGRVHLAPGEAGDFEVDPGAAEFAREGVTLTTPRAAPSARPARKAAARKAPAKKTAASTAKAPPAPPEPASPEA